MSKLITGYAARVLYRGIPTTKRGWYVLQDSLPHWDTPRVRTRAEARSMLEKMIKGLEPGEIVMEAEVAEISIDEADVVRAISVFTMLTPDNPGALDLRKGEVGEVTGRTPPQLDWEDKPWVRLAEPFDGEDIDIHNKTVKIKVGEEIPEFNSPFSRVFPELV